jgi:hypothetical protein
MRELIKIALRTSSEVINIDAKSQIQQLFSSVLEKELTDEKGNTYTIKSVKCIYFHYELGKDGFFSINVYLHNYNADDHFLYYDDTFEENLQKQFPYLKLEYSEQGMQGDDYVNLDVFL